MKTSRLSTPGSFVGHYEILEKDETGLIPEEARYALVIDDMLNRSYVSFSPRMQYPAGLEVIDEKEGDRLCKEYWKEYTKTKRRINPRRTQDENRTIVRRLKETRIR